MIQGFSSLVGGFNHGGADQLSVHGVALLQDLGNDGLAGALAFLVQNGVVEIGIKGLAFFGTGFHMILGEDLPELLEDQLDALIGSFQRRATLQIVQHRQEGGHSGQLGILIGAFLFLLGALAELSYSARIRL